MPMVWGGCRVLGGLLTCRMWDSVIHLVAGGSGIFKEERIKGILGTKKSPYFEKEV